MAALGAELTLVPSEGGLTTKKLILDMIEAARELSREPQHLLDRPAQQPRQHRGLPRARRGDLEPDARDRSTPSSTASGTGGLLARRRHRAEAHASRASGSSSSSRRSRRCSRAGTPGPHKIEGVGIGYTPPLWEPSLVDEIHAGRDRRREGDDAAPRAGGGALRGHVVGRQRRRRASSRPSGSGRSATVVTLMVDSGLKYLSTDVYRRK